MSDSAEPAHPRTALVLGAGSDIAAAVIGELGRRGLEQAVLAARSPAPAFEAMRAAAPSVRATAVGWDALDIDAHASLMAMAADTLGGIDLVLCAVGMLGHHAGLGMQPAEVDTMVRSNFAGPAAALAAAGHTLAAQGRGTIVVLSSVAGLRARKSNYVYGAAKAGLDVYAQGLGDALAPEGVRVLVVRPGFVVSKMTEGLDPAPFSTDPTTVAIRVADALGRRRDVVTVPSVLSPLFAGLQALPRGVWRRVAGDR
jgi:decaprenylphospho-beta-D-erythro-pentofuranosid-2-ulose 2-reductase